jgi:hypothetical protein
LPVTARAAADMDPTRDDGDDDDDDKKTELLS